MTASVVFKLKRSSYPFWYFLFVFSCFLPSSVPLFHFSHVHQIHYSYALLLYFLTFVCLNWQLNYSVVTYQWITALANTQDMLTFPKLEVLCGNCGTELGYFKSVLLIVTCVIILWCDMKILILNFCLHCRIINYSIFYLKTNRTCLGVSVSWYNSVKQPHG